MSLLKAQLIHQGGHVIGQSPDGERFFDAIARLAVAAQIQRDDPIICDNASI